MAGEICHEKQVSGTLPVDWFHRFVGVPFLDGGRDLEGCDCWGLVRLIYQQVLNIDLPSYGDVSAQDLIEVARNISAGYNDEPWLDVNSLKPLDVVVMRFYGSKLVGHVGVAIDSAHVLHTERSMDSVVVPLNHFTIRKRVHCFRRHRSTL